MIHSSFYRPRVFPVLADLASTEIDRVQDLSSTATLNRTKVLEVGRDGLVDWRQSIPDVSVTLRQFEHGSMEFYRQIANKSSAVTQINLTDYKTPKFDIAGYKTDDDGTFLGTIWYPNLRVSSFGLSIGSPEAEIERNFTFAGEDEVALINANKYLIHKRYVIGSTGLNQTVSISDPTPIADPDNSGQFLFKVIKHSGGTATELEHGTAWSYDGAGTLTINGSSTAGDVIWVWYSAGSYIAGESTFVNNDTDPAVIDAESVSIYLANNQYLYRLQSVSVDVTFDRSDIREIGNTEVVAQGARDITSRITLGKIIEEYTIEEVLRGKAGLSYGKIDVRKFTSNFSLIIKVFSDDTKDTFDIGYKWTDCAPVSRDTGTPVNEYITASNVLEAESGFITSVEGIL